ncbi:MAG: hypothetical protein Q8O27_00110 [Enterobacteriaceae bacterium]|nr:hypothetical protein [Enterobacteriaceae bacterium]
MVICDDLSKYIPNNSIQQTVTAADFGCYMNKRKKINVWCENPTKENASANFDKIITLYNNGEYEEELFGLEKLSDFISADLKIIFGPQIEKCKRIKEKILTNSDKRHLKNQAILKYFGWIDILKYFTGLVSFMIFSLLWENSGEGITFLFKYPKYLVLAIVLAILTFLLHIFMKKFTISQGLVRCKYCGRYTHYIDPDKLIFGSLNTNNCSKCNRSYPMPDFYWDGWDGLEYMENRHSVPDEQFYKEYAELKTTFSKEYGLYKKKKNETDKSKKI